MGDQGWSAVAGLRDHALVRHIGFSNFDVDQLRSIQGIAVQPFAEPAWIDVIARVTDLPNRDRRNRNTQHGILGRRDA